ncbi:hypothetical protein LOTGIDRAFT_140025, partial [Lottia gigantea]
SELYFLIARFLSNGPCKKTSEILLHELEENKLLPKRVDWEGREHFRSYSNLIEINSHVSADYLLRVCERLGPLVDKEVPPCVTGVRSLLGAGHMSLLRTIEDIKETKWTPSKYITLSHGYPTLPPSNLATPNICHVLHAQKLSGRSRKDIVFPTPFYKKIERYDRKLGHLSAVYCVLFDRTGQYIFTGADDHLVKVWSVKDGRLLATFRGHSAEITDIAVNFENTLLAAGSCDKMIRVWCLKTKSPVAILHGHSGMITSVQFCPQCKGETRYLLSTGGDGCVCFWTWNVVTNKFNSKPIKFIERSRAGAQMLCSSFSPGGMFLATGNSDHVIRVYFLHATAPEKICELEAHYDRVDSITYSNHSVNFVSGSKDGTARIWRYERQEWRATVLNMSTVLPCATATPNTYSSQEKPSVTMVCWSKNDLLVVTAVSDFTIKVWNSTTGKLQHILKGHDDEAFVLESNPVFHHIFVSAGHDGKVIIWDVKKGQMIKSFFNNIEGQGHGAVFDCKFSPDGLKIAATDSHGHLLVFGFGYNNKYKEVPQELFFHTDYRPLIRDTNSYVLDEQTQQAPHLMPPPFLVDIDGNPYPPKIQRLVPGREKCSPDQLVPQVAYNEEALVHQPGAQGAQEDRRSIDEMIQNLQREQDQRVARIGAEPLASPPHPQGSPRGRHPSGQVISGIFSGLVGMRRSGELEGVRQSLGNVSQRSTPRDIAALNRRRLIRDIDSQELKHNEEVRIALGDVEHKKFMCERKKRPHGAHDVSYTNFCLGRKTPFVSFYFLFQHDYALHVENRRKGGNKSRHSNQAEVAAAADNVEVTTNRLTARALYDTEDEYYDLFYSDSSVYSDWMGDRETNLQPPTRQSTRTRKRKRVSSSENDDDDDDDDNDDDDKDDDDDEEDNNTSIREVPEEFRPPEWLTDTVPRKTPYVPQMGDEVMYFRQGHEQYLKAVKRTSAYQINIERNQPWHKNPHLREQELVRIIGIHYEIRPPRLCCLRLAVIDPESGKAVGSKFSIKYHDIPDVIDFVVLRQNYDTAMARNFKPGDKFRSIIDDMWWLGTIVSQEPFQPEFPDSMYQCFNVLWDNKETEKLSPWDMELIGRNCPQSAHGEGFLVLPEEMKALLYTPKANEWPPEGRDVECDRIVHGLELLMEHRIAEYFSAPVDLSAFPSYAIVIEYPIDLSTIKARLENRFYRRVNAIQYDVRYLETNARKFNEPNSQIVQSAKILTDTILRLISDSSCRDPMPILHQLQQISNSETDEDEGGSTSKRNRTARRSKTDRSTDPDAWIENCRQLLQTVFQCEDSQPFREPISLVDHPVSLYSFSQKNLIYQDYFDKVDTPMDFTLIRDNLNANHYSNPAELCKDVRTIFQNSKLYNTNKRSRIYSMTVRLSAMFEEKIKEIQTKWKANRGKGGSRTKSRPLDQTTTGPSSSQIEPVDTSLSASSSRPRRTTRGQVPAPSSSNVNGHVNGISPMFRSKFFVGNLYHVISKYLK